MKLDSCIALGFFLVAGFLLAGASSSSSLPAKRFLDRPVSLVVSPNGTCFGVESKSGKALWAIPTGSLLSQSDGTVCSGDGNCKYARPDGSIYQFSKDYGEMNLNTTIQDLVQRSPIIEGSVVTVGSKTSTVLHVDLHTGEFLHNDRFPHSINATGHVVSELDECRSVMIIIRTNYSLNCTDRGRFLWSMRYSRFDWSVYGCHTTSVGDTVLATWNYEMPVPKTSNSKLMLLASSSNSEIFLDATEAFPIMEYEGYNSKVPKPLSAHQYLFHNDENKQLAKNGFSIPVEGQHQVPEMRNHSQVKDVLIPLISGVLIIFAFIILFSIVISLSKHKEVPPQNTTSNKINASKRKKARKARNTKANAIVNGKNHESQEFFENLTSSNGSIEKGGRWIGKLVCSDIIIGKGSNGTVVYEGVYDSRPVAVKRLVRDHNDVASKEIQNLILSDHHPNIVRYYGKEEDMNFIYIALERCQCSLSDFILHCLDKPFPPIIESSTSEAFLNPIIDIDLTYLHKNLELWDENGFPSLQLVKMMRDVVSGLAHLHYLGIIHRDMKPQNILISCDRDFNAKLSDMGISKHLLANVSSMSHHSIGFGSYGWQAPEQLKGSRLTRAVDLFGLGCILFFCLTKGKHPFGSYHDQIQNILNNRVDLFLLDDMPEAAHLISQLLDANPENRPSAKEVLFHPFFWNSEMRLSFLRDASDRFELEDRENESELIKALESVAPIAFGGKWGEKLDPLFIADMGRYRKYNFGCTRDLLRLIRNKLNHYRELSLELQEIIGLVPQGLDSYFTNRFPNLLIEVYKVIYNCCSEEKSFQKYIGSNIQSNF